MWTRGNNFLNAITIQYLNVAHGLHLKKKFIARSARRITRAGFFGAQHSKLDVHCIQNFHKSLCHTLGAIVKRAGTAYPKKNFRGFAFGG